MKRMLCLISHQLLPNFIPVNEEMTRPDVLHAIFTPSNPAMQERWESLKKVLSKQFPGLDFNEVKVNDAYDASDIKQQCKSLLAAYPHDEWSLNMTGGTKLMSSPAVEVFHDVNLPIYYVETERGGMLQISGDWQVSFLPFANSIDLQTYFELYGRRTKVGNPQTGQEGDIVRRLEKLDWHVWHSVTLYKTDAHPATTGNQLAEYDAIGIRFYQLSAFECKRLNVNKAAVHRGWVAEKALERAKTDILLDLYKLSQIQKSFGGPFGKSYWIFSGKTELSEENRERIREFGIILIRGSEINQIDKTPERFKLPRLKPIRSHSTQ
ncbi:MAG: hypothetical protein ACJ74G_12460 [Blastocatellia bacterium]